MYARLSSFQHVLQGMIIIQKKVVDNHICQVKSKLIENMQPDKVLSTENIF